MTFEPELLVDLPSVCAESPLWHESAQRVYWTDIPSGRLYRCDPESGEHELCYTGRPIGGFTLQADGSLLLFRDRGNIVVWRDGHIERTLVEEIPGLEATRFNDVCADPAGRVFCGTMAVPGGSARLYRLDLDGSLALLGDGYGTANGMGFSPDGRLLYFNDSGSAAPRTYVFDYDRASGTLANRRVFRDALASGDPGKPDGLAVDSQGFVWTARWDGEALLRHGRDGQVIDHIEFPVSKVTSLCFGGDGLREIFITTAGGDRRPATGEHAGSLFCLTGYLASGLPRPVSRVGL